MINVETEAAGGRPSRGIAVASLVLGLLSFFLLIASGLHGKSMSLWRLPFVLNLFPTTLLPFAALKLAAALSGIGAVLTGYKAIKKNARKKLGVWGTIAGSATLLLLGHFTYAFLDYRHDIDLTICYHNLEHITRGPMTEYSSSHGGSLPPLNPHAGVLMFSAEAIPATPQTERRLTCPTLRFAEPTTVGPFSPFDDQSYFYLGYAVHDDDDVEAFAQAYRKQIAAGGNFEDDLTVETPGGTWVLHRFRRGWEGELKKQDASDEANPHKTAEESAAKGLAAEVPFSVPVLIERDFNHIKVMKVGGRKVQVRGGRVAYMGGPIEFVPHGTWPMTDKTQRILAELAR